MNKLINISKLCEILNADNSRSKKMQNHTIRYWEKEFKQIKPKILTGNRRYYDEKNIEILKKIHHLLKEQGMTINGVKKILNNKEPLKLDEMGNNSINAINLKNKLVKISNIVKSLKKIK